MCGFLKKKSNNLIAVFPFKKYVSRHRVLYFLTIAEHLLYVSMIKKTFRYYNLLSHFPVGGHLSFFLIFAIMNSISIQQ